MRRLLPALALLVMIGGTFAPQYSDQTRTATIQTEDQRGSIWIKGVTIDNPGSPDPDGIVLNAAGHTAIPAYVRNVPVTNITGTQSGRHADMHAAPVPTVLIGIANAPILSQVAPLGPGVLNGIVDTFTGQSSLWEGTLEGLALDLFLTLAIIEVTWTVARALARRVDLGDMIEIVAMQIVTIGFFYWLLINSADFVLAIIASFGEAANRASVAGGGMTNLSPSDIFASGLNLAKIIWEGMTITSPGLSLLVLAGVIDVYIFAVIAAKLIEVLVESAFVAYAGIIMMGFGGSGFTREYAIAQFRYGISVGVKRFVLQLIIGLGQGIIVSWAQTVATSGALNWQTIGIMIGAPIVMLRLAETLPQRAQDMVMGASTSSSGSLGSSAQMAAATAAGIAASMVGAPVAAKAAYQLAQRQIEARRQENGQTGGRIGRAAMMTSYTVRNIGGALASDVGKRLSGQGARFGYRGWRIASDMKGKRK
jgi:type IV secretion system protein TrbL